LVPSDAVETEIEHCVGVRRIPLIARQHEAIELQAALACQRLRGGQVSSEHLLVLTRLEAVVMRESVRAHLLSRAGGNEVHERSGEMLGIVILVRSNGFAIRIKLRTSIRRTYGWQVG
jgi:hypothetical protein